VNSTWPSAPIQLTRIAGVELLRDREEPAASRYVQQPERHEHQGHTSEQREDVQGRGPVQVDGAEDLEHEHHREQRDRPVEDVLGGRVVLGQQGQPRAPETAFELADPVVASGGWSTTCIEPRRPPPRKRLASAMTAGTLSRVGFASALVIFAHPDDAEFMCGGTVAAWVNEGTDVHYCVVTDGSAGSNEPGMTREAMRPIREREQRAAAEVLGVASVSFLGFVDGELQVDLDTRRAVTRVVRRIRPEVLVAPDPSRLWFANRYINHWDHKQAGTLALCAVMPDAPSRPQFPELLDEGLEPFEVPNLWLASEDADTYVDISKTLETKIESLRAHESQGVGDSLDWVRERARQLGEEGGFEYAEGFKTFDLRDDDQDVTEPV